MIAMNTVNQTTAQPAPDAAGKMPGHWLLARLDKRVLRPGGLALTRAMLSDLAIQRSDHVVEFAPGLGVTARMAVARQPATYTAVERDRDAAAAVARRLPDPRQRCILGSAEATGLPDEAASVVYGEAMLSMQPAASKSRIVAEAARLLQPGGRYGIHELCLVPDGVSDDTRAAIQRELTDDIHVGVRPLTISEWRTLLESAGLTVTAERTAPMHLLEPLRIVRDEGLFRTARFLWNVLRNKPARQRVRGMRNVFRKYREHLAAVALVAVKPNGEQS